MFNFSFGELLILGVIGIIVIGPKQLPQVVKVLVRTMNEFKKAWSEITDSVTNEIKSEKITEQIKSAVLDQKEEEHKKDES